MIRKLHEKLEGVGPVNNMDNQELDSVTKSVAPISFVDAVDKTKKKRERIGNMFIRKSTDAKDALDKEISNDEHQEPTDEVEVREEGMITLDESLFEDVHSEGETTEHIYRVTYSVAPNIYSAVIVKAKDEEDAKMKFENRKKGKNVVGVAEMSEYEVKDMMNRGMSLISEDLKEDYNDGWSEEIVYDDLFTKLEKFMYEVRNARKGVYTRCKTYEDLAEYVRELASDLDSYADHIEELDDEDLDESLNEATVTMDFYRYEPWGDAVYTYNKIKALRKLGRLEQLIDEMYPDGIDATELNDILGFETDWLASMLAIPELADDETLQDPVKDDKMNEDLVARLYKSALGDPNYRRVQLLFNGKEVASLTATEARRFASNVLKLADSATDTPLSIKDSLHE